MTTIKEIIIPELTVLKLIKCNVLVAEISNKRFAPCSLYVVYDEERKIYTHKRTYSKDIILTIEFDSYSFLEIKEEN